MKLRVLQLASGDLWAGAEVLLFNLCRELSRNEKVELCVVLLNEGELASKLRECGIKVRVLAESELSFFQLTQQLMVICKEWHPDLIHSHRFKENVLAAGMSLLCGVPSIRTVHGASEFPEILLSKHYLVERLNVLVGRYLQRRVVAVSVDLEQKLLADYSPSTLAVVPNGVDFSLIDNAEPIISKPSRVTVGFVGRLTSVKRPDIFLDMVACLVNEKGVEVTFMVLGDGPLMDSSVEQAENLGVIDKVNFVGHVPDALPYIKSLDVLVMCSDHEGTPMVLLEVMRCGVPIVAHNVGGLKELLEGGKNGSLVSDHCAQAYAEAVVQMIENKKLREKFVRSAFLRVEDYGISSCVAKYMNLYREVLET